MLYSSKSSVSKLWTFYWEEILNLKSMSYFTSDHWLKRWGLGWPTTTTWFHVDKGEDESRGQTPPSPSSSRQPTRKPFSYSLSRPPSRSTTIFVLRNSLRQWVGVGHDFRRVPNRRYYLDWISVLKMFLFLDSIIWCDVVGTLYVQRVHGRRTEMILCSPCSRSFRILEGFVSGGQSVTT